LLAQSPVSTHFPHVHAHAVSKLQRDTDITHSLFVSPVTSASKLFGNNISRKGFFFNFGISANNNNNNDNNDDDETATPTTTMTTTKTTTAIIIIIIIIITTTRKCAVYLKLMSCR
jgi:hypothetical protein